MASFLLTKNVVQQWIKYWELSGMNGSTEGHSGPVLLIIFCASFLIIAIANGFGLKITAQKAKEGLE